MKEKIANRSSLAKIRKRLFSSVASRGLDPEGLWLSPKPEPAALPAGHYQVLVCVGGGCLSSGAAAVVQALRDEVAKCKLASKVEIIETGCMGPCAVGPVAKVMPGEVFYEHLKPEDAVEIVHSHLQAGQQVTRLLRTLPSGEVVAQMSAIPYFRRQKKVVLSKCGIINPTELQEYIALGGYDSLAQVLEEFPPDKVIATVTEAGLRGRGGGGFPTGLKWKLTRSADGQEKNVVCNADEGDPGAFMDRSLLEGDPHSVLEGMMIAGYAIGAQHGYIYCRAEYPLAIERLKIALEQLYAVGLLGQKVLGSDFSFDIEIRQGAGAFVCGEETALMASIEGRRGEPRVRPPFPAHKGLWGQPTLLNNVETFANVPLIILKGADWYSQIGTKRSKGTKIFALAGDVVNTGLVEVPIGMPLGDLLYDIGGGVPDGKEFKAAQIGGPSGGCIPKEHLNVPVDYESLTELGAIMGSGGLIVMNEDACMVDVARFFMEFVQEESCGKCGPCRIGTKRLLEILERICAGGGEEGDLSKLVELGLEIKETALCGLGRTAPNPVLSTLNYFRDEYLAHIREKRCQTGTCGMLTRAPCQSACPAGVDVPGFVSLVAEKRYEEAIKLHRERNPFAAACARVCFHTCEDRCRRSKLDSPVAIRGIKRFMADQEVSIQVPEVLTDAERAKRWVAIVGAGPAGLSCAYFLARLGYRPRVFEAEERPGGMMVQAIPAYRLPREILAREVRMIESLGVTIETGKRLGRDFTLEKLKADGWEAVFLGVGAAAALRLEIPGEEINGVAEAIDFLRQYNIRGSVPVGRQVVVCGGGNAAIDAARTALRLGAKKVSIIYRRTREEMPAYAEEIEEAENEGVAILPLLAPVAIVEAARQLAGVRCREMQLGEFDRSGRRRPEVVEQEEIVLPADQVIVAIGQKLRIGDIDGLRVNFNKQQYVQIDAATGLTSVPWLFAGGDVVTGPASVIEAVAGGERAAVGIDRMFTGEDHAFWRKDKVPDTFFDPNADPSGQRREKLPLIPVERRRNNFDEVELCWQETVALRQAQRCLRCDYGKNCGR